MPSNVLPLHLKQTFPLIILIFTEGEGYGIESRLPFKIFSTLKQMFFGVYTLLQKKVSYHEILQKKRKYLFVNLPYR